MRKAILAVVLAVPLAAIAQAQGGGSAPPAAPGPGQGGAPGAGPGPGWGGGRAVAPGARAERMEKRMQLARTLGLAEALDLDATQALKLRDELAKFDNRRLAAHQQLAASRDVLFRAAKGANVTAADVDQAIARGFDARAQLDQIDREMVQSLGRDLSPEKRARAVLFLQRFHARMGRGPGMRPGMGGMGPGGGMGYGPGGMGYRPGRGMGPGMMRGPDGGPPDDGGGDGGDDE